MRRKGIKGKEDKQWWVCETLGVKIVIEGNDMNKSFHFLSTSMSVS